MRERCARGRSITPLSPPPHPPPLSPSPLGEPVTCVADFERPLLPTKILLPCRLLVRYDVVLSRCSLRLVTRSLTSPSRVSLSAMRGQSSGTEREALEAAKSDRAAFSAAGGVPGWTNKRPHFARRLGKISWQKSQRRSVRPSVPPHPFFRHHCTVIFRRLRTSARGARAVHDRSRLLPPRARARVAAVVLASTRA